MAILKGFPPSYGIISTYGLLTQEALEVESIEPLKKSQKMVEYRSIDEPWIEEKINGEKNEVHCDGRTRIRWIEFS